MPNQQHATIIINRTPEEARLERENFMRRHGGKTAVEVMMDDIARRNLFIQRQCLNFGNFKIPTAQHLFYLSNTVASSKAIKLLSALTHSIFNTRAALYQLARMIAPKNYNIAVHLSMEDDNQTDGVAMPSISSQTRIKQMNTIRLFNAPMSAIRLIYYENYRYRYRLQY